MYTAWFPETHLKSSRVSFFKSMHLQCQCRSDKTEIFEFETLWRSFHILQLREVCTHCACRYDTSSATNGWFRQGIESPYLCNVHQECACWQMTSTKTRMERCRDANTRTGFESLTCIMRADKGENHLPQNKSLWQSLCMHWLPKLYRHHASCMRVDREIMISLPPFTINVPFPSSL